MKLVSWNVNGVRAVQNKGFVESLAQMQPDVLCLQETKAQDDQVATALEALDGYHLASYSAERKGYSGTAILSKREPLNITLGIGAQEHDNEGRVIVAEFDDFQLLNVYTPNSGSALARLDYRDEWDRAFLNYARRLDADKPLVMCGDFNVAHREIDIARPKPNYNKSAGFTQREIDGMDALHEAGFIDSFRHQHPETVRYSWWSYRAGAREKNIGWRIDYFLVSQQLSDRIAETDIVNDVHGSDHCPVALTLR
ncbi:exodeoxyribonuclease III [Gammaproteobacteria bacterium]|nr:exodeoxyribonuclease III [Gammaproteobacteria bacterium]